MCKLVKTASKTKLKTMFGLFKSQKVIIQNPSEFIEIMEKISQILAEEKFHGQAEAFTEPIKYLKVNDYIFGHDYAYDKVTYERHILGKIWNCCELVYKHVQDELTKNNFELSHRDLFDNAVWLCAQKKG